ncbi:hypothetical protein [Methanosarcina siciliae]|uniref:hypothetical protein n=1 Tax=Methanosarcina siciliae TaxID=38027 RepID=UPI000AF10729|nr:hypothetical protein [Methanosarcina siciliae]
MSGKAHPRKEEGALIKKLSKNCINLSRLQTPGKRHSVINAGLLSLEKNNWI